MTPIGPRIGAILLAAGRSTRMGPAYKLILPVDGVPMVRRAAEALRAGGACAVLVVTGHEADRVAAALAGVPVTLVHNPRFADGLSSSVRAGIARVPSDWDGALIALADMPDVAPATIAQLIGCHAPGRIVRPVDSTSAGHPVLWDRLFFPELELLTGDQGARAVLAAHASAVIACPVNDPGIHNDLDTPEAYAARTQRAHTKPN